ncbi:hypothetical protein PanWU01x14_251170 [Parasponia andersonii]|uniref:Uncharacterized protein n=1 Tax=Parasponia andersonii TaxID=3476 RepID=A0A2P5BCS1_PARAD|nr:hypothetical protein PanWU01x14_251170 [Parasponia andersonii]
MEWWPAQPLELDNDGALQWDQLVFLGPHRERWHEGKQVKKLLSPHSVTVVECWEEVKGSQSLASLATHKKNTHNLLCLLENETVKATKPINNTLVFQYHTRENDS